MSRDLEAAMSTGLQAKVVRPVLIGRLDITTDPIKAWTGPSNFAPTGTGDTALDSETFTPLAPFIDLSDIKEDQGIGGPVTLVLTGHDLDEEALRQVVRDKRAWRGQPAYLWLGLLDTDEFNVIDHPTRIMTGVMTRMTSYRNKDTSTITVTIDQDLGNARSAPFRWVDHANRLFSADTWSTYIVKLANKPGGFMEDKPQQVRMRRDDDE